jgi:predicted MPP superfamily phosphohydrolase
VVHLTDIHFARCYRREFFEAVVDSCREWPADLVVVTGDVVEDEETIAWIEPVLGRLSARLGKFAILGNHDYVHQPGSVLHELNRAGFETLEGKWTTLDVDGATLAVGGTSAPWGPIFTPGDIPEADFRLLLSHTPDQFPNARKWGMDFVLSGHNHGGQIRLPLVGPVFMPSKYSRRFDRGFFRSGSALMYVSEGVGGKHPIRFGCKPEIARFVLDAIAPPPSYRLHESPAADSVAS